MGEKMWGSACNTVSYILISFGFFFGSIPVYWDKKARRMSLIKSRKYKIRYIFTQGLTLFCDIAILMNFACKVISQDKVSSMLLSSQRVFTFSIAFWGGVGIIYTLIKYKEIAYCINIGSNYYEWFQGKIRDSRDKVILTSKETLLIKDFESRTLRLEEEQRL